MTEERRLQLAALTQLDDAYDDAPVGYIATDPSGIIIKSNRAFLQLLGYHESELVGHLRLGDLLTMAGRIWAETHFHPALTMHGHIYEVAFDLVGKDRSTIATLINAVQRRDEDGRHLFNRITVFRATERRRYEQELLLARREAEEATADLTRTTGELARVNAALTQANRELSQFTHVASHDLQAPLRVVSSYAELLTLRLGDSIDAKCADYLRRMSDMTQRMQTLVSDLLDLSRVGAGVRDDVDLGAVVTDVLRLVAADVTSAAAEIEVGTMPTVRADRRQMTQLLQNLIGNALKYRDRSRATRIGVQAEAGEGLWLITVRDNGMGFDMRYVERIFVPFERLHGDDIPGTGIGLAMCKKVVEAHGGRLWAESTLGIGSCFFFTIAHPTVVR